MKVLLFIILVLLLLCGGRIVNKASEVGIDGPSEVPYTDP